MVRSAPPQNVSFADVITAPLIAVSVATLSTIAENSSIIFMSIRFIERPGMSQVTSAMPSASTSTLKFSYDMLGLPLGLGGIGLAGFVREAHPRGIADHHQVDVGIMRALGRRAGADLEIDGVAVRAVDQMMAVGDAGLPAGGVAGPQHDLAAVLDQRDLAFDHVDEFVFLLVPVPQRRAGAGLEARDIDAELGQARDITDRALLAAARDRLEIARIGAVGPHDGLGNVDLRHGLARCYAVMGAPDLRYQRRPVASRSM